MRVAIVGSGIAGLAAAHHLRDHAAVTLFEAGG
jgi:predicted NAD/FAD-binding protein